MFSIEIRVKRNCFLEPYGKCPPPSHKVHEDLGWWFNQVVTMEAQGPCVNPECT